MILGIDTSTQVGSVALVARARVVVSRYFDIGLQHSQQLFAEIEHACSMAGCSIADLAAIGVTVGPGSFTGVRIGLAAAKGLCLVDEKPLVAVSTLAALAAGLPCVDDPVCALLDARKEQVYAGLYDNSGGLPVERVAPRAVDPSALVAERAGQRTLYIGDGADAYAALIDATPEAHRVPFHCARPHAAAVGALAWELFERGEVADLDAIEPDYLRAPDATISAKKPL